LHGEVMAFLRLYVGTKADVFLRMQVTSRRAPPPRIGCAPIGQGDAPAPRLAWTAILPSNESRLIEIPLGRYEAFPAPAANPALNAARQN